MFFVCNYFFFFSVCNMMVVDERVRIRFRVIVMGMVSLSVSKLVVMIRVVSRICVLFSLNRCECID